jgi:hypothetical protein
LDIFCPKKEGVRMFEMGFSVTPREGVRTDRNSTVTLQKMECPSS